MGVVGRYIDALNDEQRDRVIEATSWSPPEDGLFVDEDDHSCRCLVGHAADWGRMQGSWGGTVQGPRDVINNGVEVSNRFPDLQYRFGTDRIIAACKARAAKGNNLEDIRDEIYAERKETTERMAFGVVR